MAKDEPQTAPELPGAIDASKSIEELDEQAKKQTEDTDQDQTEIKGPELEPPISKEDEDLKSASEHMEDEVPAESSPHKVETPKKTKKQGNKKKPLLIILVLLLLAAAGAAVWYFVLREEASNQTSQTNTEAKDQENSTSPLTYQPDTVAYAFRASDAEPYTIYYRPAAGGERKEAMKLTSRDDTPTAFDAGGSAVVFATTDSIYASDENGKSYKKVLTLQAGEQITSLKLSTDRSSFAYGFLSDVGGKNTVKSMSISGEDAKDLFISDQAGVFIQAWNKKLNKIFYNEGCYNCGGSGPGDYLRDLNTNEVTRPATKGESVFLKSQPQISDDFSTIVYQIGNEPAAGQDFDLGQTSSAPYKVNTVSIADGKVVTLATIGTAGATNPNGTPKDWNVFSGFQPGTNSAYYIEDNKLFTVDGSQPSLSYEATTSIKQVHFASTQYQSFIVSTGAENTSDFALNNYLLKDKSTVKIFDGDGNTYIFGVTTK